MSNNRAYAQVFIFNKANVWYSSWTDDAKLDTYIRITRLLLEDEDNVQAEAYYHRAALLMGSTVTEVTQLHFKLCQARISDYSRKFLEAASRYHEISWMGLVAEEERTFALYDFIMYSSHTWIFTD